LLVDLDLQVGVLEKTSLFVYNLTPFGYFIFSLIPFKLFPFLKMLLNKRIFPLNAYSVVGAVG
jgi:hypothetical protein